MESIRIFVKKKEPNPLFKKWLSEMIAEAKKKNKKKMIETYNTALKSLEKYPLTLYSGSDCVILEGFGAKICQILNEKLEQHFKDYDGINKHLPFKDQVELLRKNDKKVLEEFINKVESDFNAEDYENCESDSDTEGYDVGESQENGIAEKQPTDAVKFNDSFEYDPPPRFSITVVDQNLTIQDILNTDEPLIVNDSSDSEKEDAVTQKSKILGRRKELKSIPSDSDEPPKKVLKKSTSVENVAESEDEFDRLVNGLDKEPEKLKSVAEFQLSQNPVSAKSGSLKRFKTFNGSGKTRNFSTPISRKIDYSTFSPISEGHERSHVDFVDLSQSPEPMVFEESKQNQKTQNVIDLSRSPEQQKPTASEKFKTPVSTNSKGSMKFRRSKTFGASLNDSPLKSLKVPEMEDSIDRIIAGYGFSPISKISPVKVQENPSEKIIDLSLSPEPPADPVKKSPHSSTNLRRSKTFAGKLDDSLESVSDVLYSEPVKTSSNSFGEDDIDKIMAKYGTPEVAKPKKKFVEKSPIKKSSPEKKGRKLIQAKLTVKAPANLKRTKSTPVMGTPSTSTAFSTQVQRTISLTRVASQVIQEEEDDELVYITVDDLNVEEFDVILLVDTAETSGYKYWI
jgi:hypothetical protein